MPKDTYSYEKCGGGWFDHFWTERDDHATNSFRITDETDSVSLIIDSSTTGMYAPTIKVETSVRITYADLRKLVERGQEILKEREPSDGE